MKKRLTLFLILLLTGLCLFTACGGDPLSALMGEGGDEEVVQLADENEIPADGIITAAQFRSIAGEDRSVAFKGKDPNGITYIWTFNGKHIKNPEEQNLKVTFEPQGTQVDGAKALAGNAPYGLGIKFDNKGLVSTAKLTVVLPEKWEADTAVLAKKAESTMAKVSNVTFNPAALTSEMTFNVVETGGEYYLVAGSSGGAGDVASNTAGNNSGGDAGQTTDNSGGSAHTCTISISCATLLDKMDKLAAGKEDFVPADGWILAPTTVAYEPGESVFDVLQRVTREAGIHMESAFTPVYNSVYVEGINQLYEFDGGELSGWMYNVNGWFPNYGCSQYTVEDGDIIEWKYTCDLGKDVGDNSMW